MLTLCVSLVRATDGQSRGEVVVYAGAVVARLSRIQRCVTLSSTGADYVVLRDCVEILFLRQVVSRFYD